jgi:cytochrome c biogenesis protein ResB
MLRALCACSSRLQQHSCWSCSRFSWQVLGFLTYDIIFRLHLDQIYTAPYFLGLMALLAASLAACTSTRCASGFRQSADRWLRRKQTGVLAPHARGGAYQKDVSKKSQG